MGRQTFATTFVGDSALPQPQLTVIVVSCFFIQGIGHSVLYTQRVKAQLDTDFYEALSQASQGPFITGSPKGTIEEKRMAVARCATPDRVPPYLIHDEIQVDRLTSYITVTAATRRMILYAVLC